MARDSFGNFQEAVWNAIRSAVRVGVVGRKESDGSTTILVPGRDHYIYVRTGATATGGEILEAFNKGIPRLAGAPVLLVKWNRIWTVIGVDADSPALTPTTFSVAYHTHLRDNGLAQSVHDLDGMPSSIAGRAGSLLRVNDDEDGYYLADATTGTGVVDSVNGQTGAVVLDSDDIAEGATNLYISDVELIKLAGIETAADVTDAANVGAAIDAAAADTPLDADKFGFWDVVDAALKSITWANLKATLVATFLTFTNKIAIAATATSGAALRVARDLASASTDSPVVEIVQDHAGDDQAALRVQQDGTGDIAAFFDGVTKVLGIADGGISTFQGNVLVESANGRIMGITGLAAGHTVNWQYGDSSNQISLTHGSGAIFNSFHGLTVKNYQGGAGALGPALTVQGHTSVDLQQWKDSGGTLRGKMAADGAFMTDGFFVVKKTGIDGTPQTIIPDGTGDVTRALHATFAGSDNISGSAAGTFVALTPGAGTVTDVIAFGTTELTFTLASTGAFSVARTSGSNTADITLTLTWL